jgi:predicted Kef-type K+ transport protein
VSSIDGQHRSAAPSVRDELADATAHGQVYLRRLRQAQLTLSVTALIAFGTIFGVLPIALYLLPSLQRARLLSVPVAVWLVAVPIFPLLFIIGALYARRAEALDESFRELVRRR